MKNNNNNNVNMNNNEKEMEEKKMTMTDIKTAMENANNARANTDSLVACEYLDTMEEMDTTFSAYNKSLLEAVYNETNTPAELMKRGHYSPLHSQWDKKNNTFKAVARVARLNVLDFIEKKGLESELPEKVKVFSEKLSAFIASEVQYDGGKKTVNVKTVVPFLQSIMDCIGIDGMIARNRDVRFLAYTVSGGSSTIGALREVSVSRVATMLIDVYTVQLAGGMYDFEKKEAEKA